LLVDQHSTILFFSTELNKPRIECHCTPEPSVLILMYFLLRCFLFVFQQSLLTNGRAVRRGVVCQFGENHTKS